MIIFKCVMRVTCVSLVQMTTIAIGLFCFSIISGATDFYVDPVNGSMDGDGSLRKPWSTMQEVWQQKKIQTQHWKTPYKKGSATLLDRNVDAPVKPGDTINLLSGYHGDLDIREAVNSTPIIVKAIEGEVPRFKKISLRSASNWIFEGLSISPSYAETYSTVTMFRVEDHNWTGPSSHITLKNSNLFSVRDTSEWTKSDWLKTVSSGVHSQGDYTLIENVKISNVGLGVKFDRAAYSEIIHSEIINISQDGIQIAGSDFFKAEYNLVSNVRSVSERNHYDLLQVWSTDGDIDGGVIRGNILLLADNENQQFLKSVQGIGMFDGWFNDFIIENNIVITAEFV